MDDVVEEWVADGVPGKVLQRLRELGAVRELVRGLGSGAPDCVEAAEALAERGREVAGRSSRALVGPCPEPKGALAAAAAAPDPTGQVGECDGPLIKRAPRRTRPSKRRPQRPCPRKRSP